MCSADMKKQKKRKKLMRDAFMNISLYKIKKPQINWKLREISYMLKKRLCQLKGKNI